MAEFEFDNIDSAVYNNASAVTMNINSRELFNCAMAVQGYREDIVAAFETVGKAWEELKLGWTGTSSTESTAWRDTYLVVVNDFFGEEGAGPDNDKKTGVLNQFAGGLKGAANGYAQVESNLKVAFEMFADELWEVGPPNGDRNNYLPAFASWSLPDAPAATKAWDDMTLTEKEAKLKADGHRDQDAPPVAANVDTDADPWFENGDTVKGEWTWTEERPGPYDLKITVKDGATWTGQPNDKVTTQWVYDDSGDPVK
ncbi:hypothetical protein ACIA8K_03790 [Catenuloplanes sp. NPDC051500]|uniref:hypothetical protein n=1 Tax=Catenuloplanes sp. NPDC051500 TaxID=3363959 RepID=UPI0037B49443